MLKGTIVKNSLKDKSILKELQIERTWNSDDWILHVVRVTEDQISQIGRCLDDGPWYVHFWEAGKDDVTIVFKDRTFKIKFSDKDTWIEAVNYGKSIGIPEEQLDFLID